MKPYGRSDKGWCCEYEDGAVNSPRRKATAGKAAKKRTRSAGTYEIKSQLAEMLMPEPHFQYEAPAEPIFSTVEENGLVYIIIGGNRP